MNGKLKGWIIGIVVVLLLLVPIFIEYANSKTVKTISYDDYSNIVAGGDFALLYFGDTSSSDYTDIKQNLLDMISEFDITAKSVDYTNLTVDEIADLTTISDKFSSESAYAIIKDSEVLYVASGDISKSELETKVNEFYNNSIPDDEVAYKTVDTYKAYMKLVNSSNITMAVFGRNSCSYCNKFKPVYNLVAQEYNLDNIYYFDSDSYDEDEFNKIMDSDLTIPASCTTTGEEQSLSDGYGTPLTLFTQNGEVIGCISGYVNKTTLISKLESLGIIE